MITFEAMITITLTEEQIAGLLCCAFEGGSSYWMRRKKLPYTTEGPMKLLLPVEIWDRETGETLTLDYTQVSYGIKVLGESRKRWAGRCIADIVADNADAETGDIFLQACMFGDLVYG